MSVFEDNEFNLTAHLMPEETGEINRTNGSQGFFREEEELIFDTVVVRTIFIIAYTIIFASCFFGNLAVILVVTLHWRMRSVTKFVLGNLAFANLCVAVFCVFQNLSTHLMDSWPFGVFLCKMYHFTNSLSYTASILILVVISVERYLVLLHPFKYRRLLSIQRLRILILGVWGLSALLCSHKLYSISIIVIPIHPTSMHHPTQANLICASRNTLIDPEKEDMVNFVVLFVIPITIMTILYTLIALYLRRYEKLMESMQCYPRGYPSCNDLEEIHSSDKYNRASSSKERSSSSNNPDSSLKHSKNYQSEICLSTASTSGFSYSRRSLTTVQNLKITKTKHSKNRFRKTSNDFTVQAESFSESKHFSSKRIRKGPLSSPEYTSEIEETMISVPACSSNPCPKDYSAEMMNARVNNGRQINASCGQRGARGGESRQRRPASEWKGLTVKTSLSQNKTRQAVVRMLIVIVVSFAVCNLPYHAKKLYQLFVKDYDFQSDFSVLMSPVTFLLMYLNCAINPILYAFMSKKFRLSFEEVMKCQCRRKDNTMPDFYA